MFVLSRTQFNSSPVVGFLENMVPALNTAVDLKSLHSQSRRASVRHALKALRLRHSIKMITSQVQFQIAKFKFRQYQNTTFFAISPNLMPAKFSRYTVLMYNLSSLYLMKKYTVAHPKPVQKKLREEDQNQIHTIGVE